jgi:hypothetical protein
LTAKGRRASNLRQVAWWVVSGRLVTDRRASKIFSLCCEPGHRHIARDVLTITLQAMEGKMFKIIAAFALNKPITFGQIEPRKPDVRVDTTKWFWNGELCCNPWQRV